MKTDVLEGCFLLDVLKQQLHIGREEIPCAANAAESADRMAQRPFYLVLGEDAQVNPPGWLRGGRLYQFWNWF